MSWITRFLALAALLMTISVASAQQPASNARLYVVTYVDVYPNFAADAAKAMQQFVADSRKDEGFVRLEVMRDVARINHFSIVEVWQSRAAYEAHLNKPHVKALREKLQPGLGSPYDERLYNLLE
jgi:quinol monooxygenase YgiN